MMALVNSAIKNSRNKLEIKEKEKIGGWDGPCPNWSEAGERCCFSPIRPFYSVLSVLRKWDRAL